MTSSKRIILKIGGEELDLTEYPALTIGDKRKLGQQGIDFSKIFDITTDNEAKLIAYIVRRARPATTDTEIDDLPIKVGQDILRHAINRSNEVESPLSNSSIPSAGTTDGASAT